MKFKEGDKLVAFKGEFCGKVVVFSLYNIFNEDIFYSKEFMYSGFYQSADFTYATPLNLALI